MATALYYSPFIPLFSPVALPVASGKLFFYLTGTLTKAPVYSDAAATIPMENPVQADLAGRFPNIYLDAAIVYRVRATDASSVALSSDIDPYLPGVAAYGPPGPSSNSFYTASDLKNAPITNLTALLAAPTFDGAYAWSAGDFTSTADKDDGVAFASTRAGYPVTAGAWVRLEEVEFITLLPRSIRPNVLAGTHTGDLTSYFDKAYAIVRAKAGGGAIRLPTGVMCMFMVCSLNVLDDQRPITIMGTGQGTQVRPPTDTNGILLEMVGVQGMLIANLTLCATADYAAKAGVLLARSTAVGSCNNNSLINVRIIGNFTKAPYVSVAAESQLVSNCLFWPTIQGPGAIIASDPAAAGVNITVPGRTLIASTNTDQRWESTEIYVTTAPVNALVMSGIHAVDFDRLRIIAPGANYFVRFMDPVGGIMGGGTNFINPHYEGSGDAIYRVEVSGNTQLSGINHSGCTTVLTTPMELLSYNTVDPANVLTMESCNFAPGRPLNIFTTGFNLSLDVASRTTIDYSRCSGAGTVNVFAQASSGSRLLGRPIDINCWSLDGTSTVPKAGLATVPTAGVYHQGATIENLSAAIGGAAAWISVHGGSVDVDPGTMTLTGTTAGSAVVTMSANYPVYRGAVVYIGNYGKTVVRLRVGNVLYLRNTMTITTGVAVALYFSGTVFGRFAPVGIVGAIQALSQADSTATDVATLKTDFNSFLAKMRTSKLLAT